MFSSISLNFDLLAVSSIWTCTDIVALCCQKIFRSNFKKIWKDASISHQVPFLSECNFLCATKLNNFSHRSWLGIYNFGSSNHLLPAISTGVEKISETCKVSKMESVVSEAPLPKEFETNDKELDALRNIRTFFYCKAPSSPPTPPCLSPPPIPAFVAYEG